MPLAHTLDDFLNEVVETKASDLHIAAGAPPMLRIDGVLTPTKLEPETILTKEEAQQLNYVYLTEVMQKEFEKDWEFDFSFDFQGKGRFRGNLAYNLGSSAGSYRPIPRVIPTMEQLGLPASLKTLTELPRGLVLVTGPTGSGKSTTLAAMIGHINQMGGCHIITIEDPVEFVHTSKNSLVMQREVGKDTPSFTSSLKYALRQDPDVVLIGEMRDRETIGAAITISETGHLVFGTLHTNSAMETINRIIDVFPPEQQTQIRTQLSFVLQGVVSQQLAPKKNGGRALVQEIMIPNLAIRNLIREDKIHQINTSMQVGQQESGMITTNQCLAALFKKGLIAKDTAIDHATNVEDLLKLIGK